MLAEHFRTLRRHENLGQPVRRLAGRASPKQERPTDQQSAEDRRRQRRQHPSHGQYATTCCNRHLLVSRDTQDDSLQVTVIDPSNASPCSGQLATWSLWAKQTGPIKLQVFRSVSGGYELVGDNGLYLNALGLNCFNVPLASQITVQAGDLLGFRYNETYKQGIIAVDLNGEQMICTIWPNEADDVAAGGVIRSNHWQSIGGRTYSLSAEIVPEPATLALLALGGLGVLRPAVRRRKTA